MHTDWIREILHRSGVLAQGPAPWGEAACVDVRGPSLLLAPLSRHGGPLLEAGRPASFQVGTHNGTFVASGIFAGSRTIEINGVSQEVLELRMHPGGLERQNRRAHFRVAVNLKGELALFTEEDLRELGLAVPEGKPTPACLEAVAEVTSSLRRVCLVREMGLGGARVFTAPPSPSPHTLFLLDFSPAPGERLSNIPGRVLESLPPGGPVLPVQVRLRFDRLPGAAEARLARFLAKVQRELLQKGIRR
jgi:hypothetical protein